ncbi:hypothetical protein NVP1026O_089 [Vibrio phage 1.026.O._10N.222.49.C7]|uniref:Uncharacterized protein n=1 Tax=Vibrio phage 1.026.O._10N.222.49.C7 TaxID=1881421 RepID=A0A2I7QMQ7_9CAUD|nr:hypothetical protein HYP57_gp096 [Vibrio phage 1.026.O._10N.222.49.C7]AUR82680.1 hypothetical protein NVP1026O_089 [Vibrio phage 1.026.O._10N.222.49.C7]
MSDPTEPTAAEMLEWLIKLGRLDDANLLFRITSDGNGQNMCTHCSYGDGSPDTCGKCMFVGYEERYRKFEKLLPMIKMLETVDD